MKGFKNGALELGTAGSEDAASGRLLPVFSRGIFAFRGGARSTYGKNRDFGLSDRVLIEDSNPRVGWLGFWDWGSLRLPIDFRLASAELERSFLIFRSGRGLHFLALDVRSWAEKIRWFEFWRAAWIESEESFPDYILQRDNVLRLSSKGGVAPGFEGGQFWEEARASSYHLYFYRKRIPRPWIQELYPKIEKTRGRLKLYNSDPRGVFDIYAERSQVVREAQVNVAN